MLVAGVHSSTQSTKVVLCRAGDGAVTGTGCAPHPGGTECDPRAWWQALLVAGRGLLGRRTHCACQQRASRTVPASTGEAGSRCG